MEKTDHAADCPFLSSRGVCTCAGDITELLDRLERFEWRLENEGQYTNASLVWRARHAIKNSI